MKKHVLLAVTILSAVSIISKASANDIQTVRDILEKCGLSGVTAESVTTVEEGNVVTLDLKNNDITKDGISFIPAEIGRLAELRMFGCSGNIIDSLPAEIGSCLKLTKIDCSSNRITLLPPTIGNLVNLTQLDLRHNQLSALPPEMARCKNLEILQLWGNKLTGIDKSVIMIPALKELYLKDNRLTTLPAAIVKRDLRYLDIMGNKLCDLSPAIDTWLKKKDKKYRQLQKCW
ncbi:MAG: leucine-rich repeat domain-containing protein [Chitinispirillaceae bacterium]|nr:leucine-rich repeat domain-containing protein [Chitinispirillaceae bacterium]